MVDADDFVSRISIRWRALGTTLIGGGVLAAWHAVSEVTLSIGESVTGLLVGGASWGSAVVGTSGGAFASGFDSAVAFVLALFYVWERVISDE